MMNLRVIRRRSAPATQSAHLVPALQLFLCALLLPASAPIGGAQGTGLILTPKDRLRGIPLADMPYTDTNFSRQPSNRAAVEARRFCIDYWRQVNASDALEVKAQLNQGYPVVIGATVDQGFLKMAPGSVWKSSQGRTLGGHAMVLVGYDDHRHAFKVLNSWGRIWGDGGYGWIDYDFFRKVVDEAFVAKDAINGPPPAANASAATAQPQPAPAAYELAFRITNIQHNVPGAGGGLLLRLDGTVSVPPGMGRSGQIVTYFSYDAGGGQKGWPVRSTWMQFSDINGMAATGTTTFSIPAEGVNLG